MRYHHIWWDIITYHLSSHTSWYLIESHHTYWWVIISHVCTQPVFDQRVMGVRHMNHTKTWKKNNRNVTKLCHTDEWVTISHVCTWPVFDQRVTSHAYGRVIILKCFLARKGIYWKQKLWPYLPRVKKTQTFISFTYEWVMSHLWMSHVLLMNESCHTYKWVMSRLWISHVTLMNEACYI